MQPGVQKPLDCWHHDVQRMACMMLDPLTEIGVGMLVAVLVRRCQRMVDLERDRKGPQCQED